jgi:hypothetical protein
MWEILTEASLVRKTIITFPKKVLGGQREPMY